MGNVIVADRRIFVTADRNRAVPEGDPKAAFLFATPGTRIPADVAEKLGIGAKGAKPGADKSARPQSNKGAKK